jgi:hypothetical protein
MKPTQDIVGLIKDIAQIVFWAIAATVALVTYRQARRTILQPIRTEVFKAQLAALSEILGMFIGKMELDLRHAFDFEKLFQVNTLALYDAFAANFFDIHFDHGTRSYDECPMFEGAATYNPGVAINHVEGGEEINAPAPDPRLRAARWASYNHDRLYINKEFVTMEARLSAILENPLLPSGLIELLAKYRSIACQNRSLVRDVLVAGAQEMAEKYPSLELFRRSKFDWLHHRYIDGFKHLRPTADEITKYIRAHFDVESLMQA